MIMARLPLDSCALEEALMLAIEREDVGLMRAGLSLLTSSPLDCSEMNRLSLIEHAMRAAKNKGWDAGVASMLRFLRLLH